LVMGLRDEEWFISNTIIQELFWIDYREPVDESSLRTFWYIHFIWILRTIKIPKPRIVREKSTARVSEIMWL
jgi:hypothetical protein